MDHGQYEEAINLGKDTGKIRAPSNNLCCREFFAGSYSVPEIWRFSKGCWGLCRFQLLVCRFQFLVLGFIVIVPRWEAGLIVEGWHIRTPPSLVAKKEDWS